MFVPKEITALAQERIELGGRVVKIGERNGFEVYSCEYDQEMSIGLPEVYIWDGEKAELISGEDALEWI